MLQASLSQEKAEKRFSLFSSNQEIYYDYLLSLPKGDSYSGELTLKFHLSKISDDLFLDYAGKEVNSFTINTNLIPSNDNYESLRDTRFLNVSSSYLKLGENTIHIKFSNIYSKDGYGLHSFIDSDGKQYLYSHCEPYHANKIYPIFDQPDLKAIFKLTVEIPKDWIAISNESINEEETSTLTSNHVDATRIAFRQTQHRLSSYLYAIIAGPYAEYKCTNLYNYIPMSVYCRESLFQYMKPHAEDLFTITIESMKFYENFFGYLFPFSKYDQIFCPEFNIGAMENPGAVTFNDDLYIFREDVVIERRTRRAMVMAHELAHMWFGDLVTMKWWNDTWLKESFADLAAHYCISILGKSSLAYLNINDGWFMLFKRKCLAYIEDQYPTTHPVSSETKNTEQAETNFDWITYAKGAASLKQLMCLMGSEQFSEGLKLYCKKYEWKNAALDEFISTLQEFYKPENPTYPSDLNQWKKEWLCIAGLNEAKVEWDSNNKSNSAQIIIRQFSSLQQFNTLRYHKMKIAFLGENGKIYEKKDIVINNTESTVIEYDGSKEPKAIILNVEDEDYIKIRLDDDSLSFLVDHLWELESQLLKGVVWTSIWDMCRDSLLSSYEFLVCIERNVLKEKNDAILSNMLNYALEAIEIFTITEQRSDLYKLMFDNVAQLLVETESAHKDRIVLLRDMLIKFTSWDESHDNFIKILQWLDGKNEKLAQIPLGVNDKWAIISDLHRYSKINDSQKKKYFDKVAESDKSDVLRIMQNKCQAIIFNKEERKKYWKQFIENDSNESLRLKAARMNGFNLNLTHFADDSKEYYKLFFETLLTIFKNQSRSYAKAFFNNLFPRGDDLEDYNQNIKKIIAFVDKSEIWLLKLLTECSDNLERRIKAYKASNQAADFIPDIGNEEIYNAMMQNISMQ